MPSRPGQSARLLDQLLTSTDPIAIEAAIARLAISGRPALRLVLATLAGAPSPQAERLLRVLERIGEASALPTILQWLEHPDRDVALAAVDATGALLDTPSPETAAAALDALTALLLDPNRPADVRLRALEAISTGPDRSPTYAADIVEPLRAKLREDPSDEVRAALAASTDVPVADADQSGLRLESFQAAPGDLPADPEPLRRALAAARDDVPLTALHRVVERVRAHEATLDAESVEPWRVVRATAHQALARRGSRLAVYDLRETLEHLGAHTPVGMLSSLQQVGDASVLEAVADAYQDATDPWFRNQLTAIFRDVVSRERLTRRSAVVRKLAARLPTVVAELW